MTVLPKWNFVSQWNKFPPSYLRLPSTTFPSNPMQPITVYSTTTDFLRVILQGPPGAGKSCLASQFPKPYFVDIDVNLGGTLRWCRINNKQLPVGFDTIDRDETGAMVPMAARYARLDRLLQEAQANPAIETIVLDSATNLADVLVAETLRKQGKSVMSKQEWGFFFSYGKALMGTLSSMRKHIVLTAHEKVNKNEAGAVVYPIKLAWPGQLGQIIGAFFTDVWRCEVETKPSGLATEYSWIVRTMPDYQYELKNSLGLPPKFKFDWNLVVERLKGGAK